MLSTSVWKKSWDVKNSSYSLPPEHCFWALPHLPERQWEALSFGARGSAFPGKSELTAAHTPLARVRGKDTLFGHLLCQEGSHKPGAQLKPLFLALEAAELLPQTECQGRAKAPGGSCGLGLVCVLSSASSPIPLYILTLSLAAGAVPPCNNSSLQRERSWFSQLSTEMSVHACLGAERFEMSREIAVTASASLGVQQRAGPPAGDVGSPGLLWESGGLAAAGGIILGLGGAR